MFEWIVLSVDLSLPPKSVVNAGGRREKESDVKDGRTEVQAEYPRHQVLKSVNIRL